MSKLAEAAASKATAKNAHYGEHVAALHWYAVWLTYAAARARRAGPRDLGCSDRGAPVTAPRGIRSDTTVGIQIGLATWLSADTTPQATSAAVGPGIWLSSSDGLS